MRGGRALTHRVLLALAEIKGLGGVVSLLAAPLLRQAGALSLLKAEEVLPPNAHALLLKAEYGLVGFQGRKDELHELRDWCRAEGGLASRIVWGGPGCGKTRLAMEVCAWMRSENWEAGFFDAEALTRHPDWLDGFRTPRQGVERRCAGGSEATSGPGQDPLRLCGEFAFAISVLTEVCFVFANFLRAGRRAR